MISLLLAFGQGFLDTDLSVLTTLRKGELVRCYQRGGRTRNGTYQALVVVTRSKVYNKTYMDSIAVPVSPASLMEWTAAIQASPLQSLKQSPRENPMFPSAYDAMDIFLSYRRGKEVIQWTNEKYKEPEKHPLLDLLKRNLPS